MTTWTTAPISARTRDILTDADIDGLLLYLPEQLSRAEYEPVKQILTALEGVWSSGREAFVFPPATDIASGIHAILASGRLPLAPKTSGGFVRTPPDLADDLCGYPHTDLESLPTGSRVLEPSAGDGSLAAAILRTNPQVTVTAVEPNQRRATACATLGDPVTVHTVDFETFAAQAIRAGDRYDAIIMNPPFAVPKNKTLWIDHLRLAWHLLAPGATLVCVAPEGLAYRSDSQHADIRAFVDHHGSRARLPGRDPFAPSGVLGPAWMIRMTKPFAPGGLDFLITRPDTEPVRVTEPQLTAQAVTAAPVQVWWDAWRSQDRILRYRARCIRCGWLLWGFDDGDNDPRGVLGNFTAGSSLDPDEYGMTGPAVGLCFGCGNDADHYNAGVAKAHSMWSPAPERTPAPVS
ncbi:SAM-dependent methyltransferase [Catelliglobosispora koreensis]|uniref:SAM-dependent methyltransferase n=1 Tax=Catelliglobosispora koreensis TaxID=129052 RepID=UPI00037F6427|nr:SAM-dependent methyltransferase [Catelliglobosispora koreensis]